MPRKKSETVRKGYNKIASIYHEQRNKYKNKPLLKKFSKQLTKGSGIIDFDCGAGIPVAKFLTDEGYNVTGIDFSEDMVKLTRKNVPDAKFKKMDITNMKFKTDSFDGAVSFYFMPSSISQEKNTRASIKTSIRSSNLAL